VGRGEKGLKKEKKWWEKKGKRVAGAWTSTPIFGEERKL